MESYYKERKYPQMLEYGIEFFSQKTRAGDIAANPHVHEAVELLYIKEGSFTVSCDGIECDTGVGDLVLFRSNCIHTVRAGAQKNNSYYVFKISPTLLFSLMPEKNAGRYILNLMLFSENSKFLFTSDNLMKTEIPSGFKRLAMAQTSPSLTRDITLRAAAFSVVCELICELEREYGNESRPTASNSSQIYEGMRYINEHFSEDLTAEEMSERLNISYSYFSRTFMKATGMSFRQYLSLVRIRKAEELLLMTDKSITEVAGLVGFNSTSHFIATYKKQKGTTPYKYKNKDNH